MNDLLKKPDTQSLTASDFCVEPSKIEAVMARHTQQGYDCDDPAWKSIAAHAIGNRKLGHRRWLKRMLKMGRNAREQSDVRSAYDKHWNIAPSLDEYVAALDSRTITMSWRGHGYQCAPQALRHIHMLYVMQAIDTLQPKRVLEVGCGNGNVILSLSALYPDIEFCGADLTPTGIETARAAQRLDTLPESIARDFPQALRDPGAHRRVELHVSDARNLPFTDRSFDLVYTRLALEQMEMIREKALAEIARVTGMAFVLIEPWFDFNRKDPGRTYVRRQGYFTGKSAAVRKLGFEPILATADLPQKVQFSAGPVVALRRPPPSPAR